MKKLIALLTAVIMLFSVTGTIYAAPLSKSNDIRLCYNSEFNFTTTEQNGENNTIVRTFNRDSSESIATLGFASDNAELSEAKKAETRAILSTLGMEEEFINQLSNESLQEYATSAKITSTVSYIKMTADGTSINVAEEEAIAAITGTRGPVLPPEVDPDPTWNSSVQDSYMKLVFVVSYLGQGRYKFSVDATWLIPPILRIAESLGACAQNFTVENNTRSGWYSYDTIHENSNTISHTTLTFQASAFQNAINGNWYGSGVVFDLIQDDSAGSNSNLPTYTYINHKIHYEYKGIVNYPTLETYFNTTATYEHTKIDIVPSMSLGISFSGLDAYIGLTGVLSSDIWTATLGSSIHYVPD